MTAKNTHPTLRDMIALEIPGRLKISPQGTKIAYLVRKTSASRSPTRWSCTGA